MLSVTTLKIFVSFFSSPVVTMMFTKIKVFQSGSAMTAHLSPVFQLWSLCCGGSAEGAISSDLFLEQCRACLWPGPCGEPSP